MVLDAVRGLVRDKHPFLLCVSIKAFVSKRPVALIVGEALILIDLLLLVGKVAH